MSSSFLTVSQMEEFAPGQCGNPNTPWCCPPTEMRLNTFTVGQRCTRARLGGREGREGKEGRKGRMGQEGREDRMEEEGREDEGRENGGRENGGREEGEGGARKGIHKSWKRGIKRRKRERGKGRGEGRGDYGIVEREENGGR